MNRWVVIFAAVFLLIGADPVLAWGPVTHVGLANTLLGRLDLLPAVVAAILARHRLTYLFGNIAADIVFAKRWSRVKQFCHHWSTGFKVLEQAEDERSKAFAYGYLSHLAADTVAHGKYVPHQVTLTGLPINLGHFYWELRADSQEPASNTQLLQQVIRQNYSQQHDHLSRHLRDTFLSYPLNRFVFSQLNALSGDERLQQAVNLFAKFSRFDLSEQLLAAYRGECVDRIESMLKEGTKASLLKEDPNGTPALMQVYAQRRELRRLRRSSVPIERRVQERSMGFKPRPVASQVQIHRQVEPALSRCAGIEY